jgi:hypothetical protein
MAAKYTNEQRIKLAVIWSQYRKSEPSSEQGRRELIGKVDAALGRKKAPYELDSTDAFSLYKQYWGLVRSIGGKTLKELETRHPIKTEKGNIPLEEVIRVIHPHEIPYEASVVQPLAMGENVYGIDCHIGRLVVRESVIDRNKDARVVAEERLASLNLGDKTKLIYQK